MKLPPMAIAGSSSNSSSFSKLKKGGGRKAAAAAASKRAAVPIDEPTAIRAVRTRRMLDPGVPKCEAKRYRPRPNRPPFPRAVPLAILASNPSSAAPGMRSAR